MKKEEEEEGEEGLCCCEYVNSRGERSHVAACCCDCEDLDDAFDRWAKRISAGASAVCETQVDELLLAIQDPLPTLIPLNRLFMKSVPSLIQGVSIHSFDAFTDKLLLQSK